MDEEHITALIAKFLKNNFDSHLLVSYFFYLAKFHPQKHQSGKVEKSHKVNGVKG